MISCSANAYEEGGGLPCANLVFLRVGVLQLLAIQVFVTDLPATSSNRRLLEQWRFTLFQ
jgi:hypothetical protein